MSDSCRSKVLVVKDRGSLSIESIISLVQNLTHIIHCFLAVQVKRGQIVASWTAIVSIDLMAFGQATSARLKAVIGSYTIRKWVNMILSNINFGN